MVSSRCYLAASLFLALGLATGCSRVADEYLLVGSAFTETGRIDWGAGLAGRYDSGSGPTRRRQHLWNLLCDEVQRSPDDRETVRLQAIPDGGYVAVLERDGHQLARRRLDLTPDRGLYRRRPERYARIAVLINATGYRRLWMGRDTTDGLLLARVDAGTGWFLIFGFVRHLGLVEHARFAAVE